MFEKYQRTLGNKSDLSQDKNLAKLLSVIRNMNSEISQAKNGNVVLVIGATGAGKSTFINYIANKELKLEYDDGGLTKKIVCKDPIAKIGHDSKSQTDKPQLYKEPKTGLYFTDCPGFFDNRGVDVEVANAFGIQNIAKQSKEVKGIILMVEGSAFKGGRGRLLAESLQATLKFLGPNMSENLDSVLLMITKVKAKKVDAFSKFINKHQKMFPICYNLLKRGNVGFYNPLSQENLLSKGVYNRDSLLTKVNSFKGIPESKHAFNVVISDPAKLELIGLMSLIGSKIRHHLLNKKFDELPKLCQLSEALSQVNIGSLQDEAEKLEDMVKDQIKMFEHQDDGKESLMMLKDQMPTGYQPIIKQTLQCLEKRLEKEKEAEEKRQEMQSELQDSKTSIENLQGEQSKLEKELKDAKITQEQYEEKNQELEQSIRNTKEAYQETKSSLSNLTSKLETERSNNRTRIDEMRQQIINSEKKSERKIDSLQRELKEARNSKPRAPMFPGIPVIIRGPFPGPFVMR